MKRIAFICLLALVANGNAYARTGGESVGGGDACEKRIQEIRDDIKSWIEKGGANELQNLPVSAQEYANRMQEVLKTTVQNDGSVKPAAQIECTDKPVAVQGLEKTCRFDKSQDGFKITCNNGRFLNKNLMSEDEQYRLIHHEYAGLAGLENPSDSQSVYTISDQISSFLESQTVKKLVVKKKVGEELLFAGKEKVSGLSCSISLEEQNAEAQMYTVIYRAGEKTLRFYNQVLQPNQGIRINGLFKKHGSDYDSEIGGPIFPLGNYHEVTLTETAEGYVIQTDVRMAAVVGSITVSSQSDLCQR